MTMNSQKAIIDSKTLATYLKRQHCHRSLLFHISVGNINITINYHLQTQDQASLIKIQCTLKFENDFLKRGGDQGQDLL